MEYNEKLCRLCLQLDFNYDRKPLPSEVIHGLKDIFNIRLLDTNQNLPRHICPDCASAVSQFYGFYVDKMANQAKLLLGLDKFMCSTSSAPYEGVSNVQETSNEIRASRSTVSLDERDFDSTSDAEMPDEDSPILGQPSDLRRELETHEETLNREAAQQTFLMNQEADEDGLESDSDESLSQNDPVEQESESPRTPLPTLANNPNFIPSKERAPLIGESYDTFTSSQAYSQETAISDDFANDPTYTPPESVVDDGGSQSSSTDDEVAVLDMVETTISRATTPDAQTEKYDSDDSDVQITGMISSLDNSIKRKMAQPSITKFFVTKKEKLEHLSKVNKITKYFTTQDSNSVV